MGQGWPRLVGLCSFKSGHPTTCCICFALNKEDSFVCLEPLSFSKLGCVSAQVLDQYGSYEPCWLCVCRGLAVKIALKL